MKVSAVITLASPLSRSGSDRWGQFIRQNGERNHWWLGRKLTPEEFNAEFPKAVRFAGPDRPLVGFLFVEAEDGVEQASEPVAMITLAEHDQKIADIQAGVNDWQTAQNAKLAEALAQIEQLEQGMRQAHAQIMELESKLAEAGKTTTAISQEPGDESAPTGSEPDSSGATGQALPPDSPPEKPAAPPAPKKAKKK